jgi:sigma-B regulation protein RsbU (phosphoserine phosphatase)
MTGILCRFEPASDKQTCEVELCNAGHPYPLLFNAKTNEVQELKGNDGAKHYGAIGMKGIMVSFAQSNFVMETDDMLIFYTDGLTEASNSRQEQFGIEKIKEIIKECHERETNEIIERILKDVDEFSEHRGFDDDITIIIAKRTDGSKYVEGEYADEDNLEADDDEQQYEELEAVD